MSMKGMVVILVFALGVASCEEEGCEPAGSGSCCKVCKDSKPCGDSCIARNQTCNVGPGCACSGFSVDAQ